MGMRFVVFGLILAAILASAFDQSAVGPVERVLEIFFWLGAILVTCGVALWPFAGRDQRAELELERQTWAERQRVQGAARSASHRHVGPRRPRKSRTIRCD